MNNTQISEKINRLSDLLTLLEDNPYKIEAFKKVSRIINNHPEEMSILIDENRLKDLPGVGESIGNLILYYAKSGTTCLERELESKLPTGLPELLDLRGLGIKKVQSLWKDYKITNISMLEKVCRSDILSGWRGFGSKLQQKLLESIAFKNKHHKDFHLDFAIRIADVWLQKLRTVPSFVRVELSGQIRRRDTLIQEIDIIIESSLDSPIGELKHFVNVEVRDTEPTLVIDPSGLPLNLWFSSAKDFQCRQLMLTGGAIYLEHIESTLRSKNMDFNLTTISDFDAVDISEKDLCKRLDINWIEPELRDGFSEFTATSLIHSNDIKGVIHAHSTWSDGRNSLKEMAEGAIRLGYQYLGISEHSQAAYYANGLKPDRVKAQWNRIDELNEEFSDFHIFKGIEVDILKDGDLDYDDELLAGFDFVIASIHSHFHLSPENQTDRIIRALQSPFITMLGHPTGRMLLAREGYSPDLNAIIDVAGEYNKIIELNSTPKRLDLDWRVLKSAIENGVKISINPDAHGIDGMNSIPLGVSMARKGGLLASQVINTMDVTKLANSFGSRRST